MNQPVSTGPPEPECFPLGIITAREPVTGDRWIEDRWSVLGAVAVAATEAGAGRPQLLRSGPEGEQYLWIGMSLCLAPAEADAYYYNLIGTNPSVYVYCERDEAGALVPVAATLEYIDAMAHGEFGNEVFAVPIPPEIYRHIERYVLAHFVPEEPRLRRKPGEGERPGRGTGGRCG